MSSKFIPNDFKGLVKSKGNADDLIKKGEKYLDNNDYEKAILYFNNLIKDDADDYRIYLSLSKAYHEISSYEEELNVIMQYVIKYPEMLEYFKSSLEKLAEMGYFDLKQLNLDDNQ